MKRNIRQITLLLLFAMSFTVVAAGQTAKENIEQLRSSISALEYDLKELEFRINRAYYEIFVDNTKRANRTISVFAYRGFDSQELYSNVPHISALHKEYAVADEKLRTTLEKDRQYRKARKIQQKSTDKETRDKAMEVITAVYGRLERDSPEYREARKEYRETLRAQNVAIVLYLLDEHHERGSLLPTDPIIPPADLKSIRDNTFEISNMESDKATMLLLLRQLKQRLIRAEYDNITPQAGTVIL